MITKITYNFFLISCLFSVLNINSQNSIITGIILNTENNPIENVSLNYNQIGTISNKNGFYILEIPSNKTVRIKFSHISYESIIKSIELKINKILIRFNELENENLDLKREINLLIEKNKSQVFELNSKVSEIEALKIAGSMLGSNNDKRASRLKINALIRDINDCIASLKD